MRGKKLAILSLAAAGGYYLYTEKSGRNYVGLEEVKGQVFILTGATNPGIGKETARDLAKRGGKIILGAKNLDRCHQARQHLIQSTQYINHEIDCSYLDLKSLKSIKKFVDELPKDLPLKAVIETAETVKKTRREETHDGLEKQMGVSHFGHFYLNQLLIDKFHKSAPWRIVMATNPAWDVPVINFADINSEHSYDASKVYRQAKFATMLTALELGNRLKGTAITANAVYPGTNNTDVYRHFAGNHPFFIKVALQPLLRFLFTSPEKAAQTVLYAVLSPKLVNTTGQYIQNCDVQPFPSYVTEETAHKLWQLSETVLANPAKFVAAQKVDESWKHV